MKSYKLKEICNKITDGSHNPPKGVETSEYLMLSSKNINNDLITYSDPRYLQKDMFELENKRTNIERGDILLTIVGTVGRCAVYDSDEKVVFQRSVAVIKPNKEIVDSRFLMYKLISMTNYFEKEARGVAQKGIYLKQLADIEIKLPNLEMQKKIVYTLDSAKVLLDKRGVQITLLDQLVKSRFIEMFGDPVNNPRGWKKAICKDITSKIGSGATPKGGNSSYKEEGISLIRSMNVHNNKFIIKDLAFIDDEQAQKLNNVIVEENDILLNITGASVARCCIVPNELIPARVNQHVAIIRSKNEEILPIFLVYQFTNDSYQRLLWDIATSGGATREAITKQQIENLELIVPPIELQNQFEDFVNKVDKLKFAMESSLKELENNFNSLMQKTFNGELFN
ncbi:restriction endonuclease subunit S [Clostridium butyricum]|uniref:Restriction endonuclease subunit S n=1 Tax=Clostridium butyricum TaxID=1492 RepID=A0A6L9ETL3_CLOBU|nr:restriction endonuclease subunit S [Clostridium butyricum]